MSTYPPPPGSPFGFTAKQAARMARQTFKAQARAAAFAAKAQRDMYRYQTRGLRRSSILGPLLILAIGVVILLIRMGRIPLAGFTEWYGHWWPLFLVAAGVVLVAEWAFDQMPRADGSPYVRRGVGGGAIFLLIMLAITGASIRGLHTGQDFFLNNLHFGDDGSFDEFFGSRHDTTEPLEADFAAGSSLAIDNPHGNVTIVGKSGDDKVHIVVDKHVWGDSDSDADSRAERLNPSVVQAGSILSISVPTLSGSTADLNVTVPDFGETTVTASHGDISVNGINAPVTLTANHGSITVGAIQGAVNARINNGGSSFTAHQVDGDVQVHGHADNLSVTDVSGHTYLEGEFNGDTHLERLRGPMNFHTSRTQFSLQRLDGAVDISPDAALYASQLVGPTSVHTRSRNITFDRVAGAVDVTNSNGSVDITAAAPLGDISITNRNGEVHLILPQGAGFLLDADTTDGTIETDSDLHPETHGAHTSVAGKVGAGGPKITVRTTHFNVEIHSKPYPADKPQSDKDKKSL
jgi:DUF4097 and DUF4098 domain-containing protein YvlB